MKTTKGLRLAVVTAQTNTQLHTAPNTLHTCACTPCSQLGLVVQLYPFCETDARSELVGDCLHLWSVCPRVHHHTESKPFVGDMIVLLACSTLDTHPPKLCCMGSFTFWQRQLNASAMSKLLEKFQADGFDACYVSITAQLPQASHVPS